MFRSVLSLSLILTFFCAQSSQAGDNPYQGIRWELGAGLAAFDIPLYVGSSQTKQYLIPVPYAKLLTEYLEFDEGLRGFLFTSERVRLDFSADAGVPVRSKDSVVRRGMPNLRTVIQIGPSLEITLLGNRKGEDELRLEFPVRVAFSTDIKNNENIGRIVEPRFTYEKRRQREERLYYSATFGMRYASSDYHAYYYDVDPVFASAQRPAYSSEGGYSGMIANLVASWRENNLIYWASLRYRNLNGAVYRNSPLVEDNEYYLFGVGITWVLAGNY